MSCEQTPVSIILQLKSEIPNPMDSSRNKIHRFWGKQRDKQTADNSHDGHLPVVVIRYGEVRPNRLDIHYPVEYLPFYSTPYPYAAIGTWLTILKAQSN